MKYNKSNKKIKTAVILNSQTLLCHGLESLCEHFILKIVENYPAPYDHEK